MKTELEPSEIEQIAQRVVELIKPVLLSISQDGQELIVDKKGLSEYLNVDVSWIDHNLHAIPHFKVGKYVRFKKSSIDLWAKRNENTPSPYLKVLEGRK